MGIGGMEWVLVAMAVLLLFGAKRIPELARGLGQGIKEFRKASDDIRKEIDRGQRDVMESTKYNIGDERREDKQSGSKTPSNPEKEKSAVTGDETGSKQPESTPERHNHSD
ncbi:MAG: twin-arginine translocase TatA/TatE family subunit [Balneolaceae bacterium]